MAEDKIPFWRDPIWIRSNWKSLIAVAIMIVGAVVSYALLRDDVETQGGKLEVTEAKVDEIEKGHMLLNQSFHSYQASVADDIHDIEEAIESIQEDQSESHDMLIQISTTLGVE